MIVAKQIIVRGRVQGVNFRYYTKQEALRLGICGSVQNRDDGSVMIRAEGKEGLMKTFVEWCTHGPARARVEEMEVEDMERVGYREFSINR